MKQDAITYEELADPKWKGKICIRSGQHVYNISLIAAMIAHKGEAKAEEWLKGVKANLASKPAGGDREQAKDILAGVCDIALGNTYYVGLMRTATKRSRRNGPRRSRSCCRPSRDRRHACQHLRRGAGEERAEQGRTP